MTANSDGSALDLGRPSLGEKVEAELLSHGKDKKVLVVKYKSKTRYKRSIGHQQEFSQIKISKIS
jgi:large subunit ribosomal protein L21